MNSYGLEMLVQARLSELREQAAVAALRAAVQRCTPPLRVRFGQALVRIGTRLATGFTPVRAAA